MFDNKKVGNMPHVGAWHRKRKREKGDVQREEADEVSRRAMERLVSRQLEMMLVRLVKRPQEEASRASWEDLNDAGELITRLETAFLSWGGESVSKEERALVQRDANHRIGELATVMAGSYLWKEWRRRCPEMELERLALLCHSLT